MKKLIKTFLVIYKDLSSLKIIIKYIKHLLKLNIYYNFKY